MAAKLFNKRTLGVTSDDFIKALKDKKYDLCAGMAKVRAVNVALVRPHV